MSIIVTNVWTIFHYLHDFPRFLLMLDFTGIIGLASYFVTIALTDAILLWLFIVFFAIIIPQRFFRENFGLQGAIVTLVLASFVMLFHLDRLQFSSAQQFYLTALLLVALMIGITYFLPRFPKIHDGATVIIERLTILGYLYIAIDLISLLIVLIRNV